MKSNQGGCSPPDHPRKGHWFNKSNSKNYSVFWYQDGVPKLTKVYSDNNIKGLNWVGIKENKVIKESAYKKQSLFDWYILLLGLLMFLFLSWYRESKI